MTTIARSLALPAAAFLFAVAAMPAAAKSDCGPGAAAVSSFHYVVDGVSYSESELTAHAGSGDPVTVVFTVDCAVQTFTFVAYDATSSAFTLETQTVKSYETSSFGPGTHSLNLTLPPCYYQLEFATGERITQLDSVHGATYIGEGRFISGIQSGHECNAAAATTSPAPRVASRAATTAETTSPTEIPFFPTSFALATAALGSGIAAVVVLRRRL